MALATNELAMTAHALLGADVTIEDPDSHLYGNWGSTNGEGAYTDWRFSQCMLGDDIAKPTRIRAWGISLPSMQPVCVWYPSKQSFSCGRMRDVPHVLLSTNRPGGKRLSTWKVAAYQP